jgi:lauroyl/myristoyl acyltransferase
VVPMFATRDEKDRLTLRIRPEIDLTRTEDLQQDVSANTALFTHQLEQMIRRYPDQWNWLGFRQDGRGPGRKVATPKADLRDQQDDSPSLP